MAMTTWVGEESEVGVMASLVTPPHLPLTNHLPSINKKQKGKGGGRSLYFSKTITIGNEVSGVQCGGDFWSD